MKKDRKKYNTSREFILGILIIFLVVIAIYSIKYNFAKINKAKELCDNILETYFNN